MADYGPDKRSVVAGKYNVDLVRGILRDTVRVWVDVWPAAGGTVGMHTTWHWNGYQLWREMVAKVRAAVNERCPSCNGPTFPAGRGDRVAPWPVPGECPNEFHLQGYNYT